MRLILRRNQPTGVVNRPPAALGPDCKELSDFLKDPEREDAPAPPGQGPSATFAPGHRSQALDTTHTTERLGRPFTLVCTKTKDSYDRALKTHRVDLDHLAKIRKLYNWLDSLRKHRGRAASRK